MIKKPEPLPLATIAILLLGVAILALLPKPSLPPVTHYANPYPTSGDFLPIVEGIYRADKDFVPPKDVVIRAAIVPHHLTAGETIATGIKALVGQSFKKILLISPDHFNQCPTLACTTNGDYQTLYGEVRADQTTLSTLLTSSLMTDQPAMFKQEHGIYAVLPFIAHYFPGVPVTPIALNEDRPWRQDQAALLQLVDAAVDDQTMLIISSDFSHYLPLDQANAKDAETIATLDSGDLEAIGKLEDPSQVCNPIGVWLVSAYAKQRNFFHPMVMKHSNSALILNDPTVASTTSHFAIIWTEE